DGLPRPCCGPETPRAGAVHSPSPDRHRPAAPSTIARAPELQHSAQPQRLFLNAIPDASTTQDARWRSPAIVAAGRLTRDVTTTLWQAPATQSWSREAPEQALRGCS